LDLSSILCYNNFLDVDYDVARAVYFASEVVVRPACSLTTTSMLGCGFLVVWVLIPNCSPNVGREVCVLVSDDSSIVPLTRCLVCGGVEVVVALLPQQLLEC
jgi:hypothetical protein